MPRFEGPPDPLFARLNASIGFDRRLWPEDSPARGRTREALHRAGVLDDAELRGAARGPRRRRRRARGAASFEFHDDDEDIHMAIERRLTELVGPVGGKLHTGRSRNDQVATDLALFVRARAERALELTAALMARLLELAERARRLADARLHPPAARPAGLPRPPPARLLLDAQPRRAALRRGPRRGAASCRSAPARSPGLNWDLDRAATAARARLRARRRRTRSTRSPTATSSSTTSTRPPSAPPTSRGSAPRS